MWDVGLKIQVEVLEQQDWETETEIPTLSQRS